MNNPWYHRTILEHERDDETYSFNLVGITRRDSDGKLFWSTDSGCSCPSPWGSHSEADWQPLAETYPDFLAAVNESKPQCRPDGFLDEVKKLQAAHP